MGLSAPLVLILCSVGLSLAQNDAYIIVKLEEPGRTLVKRQAQYQPQQLQHQQPQYAAQTQQPQYAAQPQSQDQQISPDYLNYLQQLQQLTAQSQSQAAPQQQYNSPQPAPYLQQSLQSTAPQSFLSQGPPIRPQIPEDQRILQESIARRPIVNQEREDQRNRHLISLGIDPVTLRRQQAQEKIARQQAEQAAQAAVRAHQSSAEEQLAAFFADAGPQQIVPQIQHYPIPQTIPVRQQQEEPSPQQAPLSQDQHQRVSYSQLSFGNPRPTLLRDSQQQLPYRPVQSAAQYAQQPLPQQQVSYEPVNELFAPKVVQQKAANKPQEKIIFHTPQQVTYVQPTEQGGQIPQQFLIETTKVQDQPSTVLIPKRVNYRPQANYKDIQASIAAQHQLAQLARQQLEAATTSVPPSRSAIFVTTARTPTHKAYASFPEYRIPKNEQQRPLTQSELNALINAGFSVTPSPNQPEYQQFFRDLSKRQNVRPAVGRVSLSAEDKQELAKNGVRSLYRVQGAESRDTPVRYVLALNSQKRDTDKA